MRRVQALFFAVSRSRGLRPIEPARIHRRADPSILVEVVRPAEWIRRDPRDEPLEDELRERDRPDADARAVALRGGLERRRVALQRGADDLAPHRATRLVVPRLRLELPEEGDSRLGGVPLHVLREHVVPQVPRRSRRARRPLEVPARELAVSLVQERIHRTMEREDVAIRHVADALLEQRVRVIDETEAGEHVRAHLVRVPVPRIEVGDELEERPELLPAALVAPRVADVLNGPQPRHVRRERGVAERQPPERGGSRDERDVIRLLLSHADPASHAAGRGEQRDRQGGVGEDAGTHCSGSDSQEVQPGQRVGALARADATRSAAA